jgi:hypothetical protein
MLMTLLFLSLVSSLYGQEPISVTDLQAKVKAEKIKDLIIKYDKFKDKTTITTKPQNLVGSNEGAMAIFASGMLGAGGQTMLMLEFGGGFKGDKLSSTIDEFIIGFGSTSKGKWQFLKGNKNLYLLFDEQRLEFEPIADDASVSLDFFGSSINTKESLYFLVKRQELERIISAKKIEIKLGDSKPREWKSETVKRISGLLAATRL